MLDEFVLFYVIKLRKVKCDGSRDTLFPFPVTLLKRLGSLLIIFILRVELILI